jgi:hypothetical protein
VRAMINKVDPMIPDFTSTEASIAVTLFDSNYNSFTYKECCFGVRIT